MLTAAGEPAPRSPGSASADRCSPAVDPTPGRYAVHDLSPGSAREHDPAVLAVHGITANGYWWLPLAARLAGRAARVRLFAVCLRGRADSRDMGGPYGLAVSAADLAGVSRALRVRPLLLGHSLGAFVVALALARHPQTFAPGALLVDGGLALPEPAVHDPPALAAALLRPALRHLGRLFPDEDAYVAGWSSHPGLRRASASGDPALLRAVALHDAVPAAGTAGLRCGVVPEAVDADARDLAGDPAVTTALQAAVNRGLPVELLWARRGLLDQPRGFYDEALLARWAPAGLRTTGVEGANHLSVVLSDPGVSAVADALERLTADKAGPGSGERR